MRSNGYARFSAEYCEKAAIEGFYIQRNPAPTRRKAAVRNSLGGGNISDKK